MPPISARAFDSPRLRGFNPFTMKNASLPVLSFVLVGLLSSHAADWPRFRGPDQNGISKESGISASLLEGGGKVLWKASIGIGFCSISVANGRAYTMGNQKAAGGNEKDEDTVWCLDAITGKEIWKHSYAEDLKSNLYEGGPNATPTVDGNQVFTLSKTGRAFCLDAAKGTVIWEKNLAKDLGAKKPEWGFSSSVLVEGDVAIYNVGTAGTALNRKTGEVVWKSGAGVAGYSAAVLFNQGKERLAIMMTAADATAFNPADGKIAWSHPWKTSYDVNAADAVVSGNKFFLSSGYNHGSSVIEVKDNKPSVVWENKNIRNHFASSVFWKGHLYGVDEKELRCVDFATGKVKWVDKVSGKGTLLMADGKIVVLTEKGELIIAAASPEAFKPLGRAQILGGKCWTMPSLANGKLYARNAKGDLVCVEVGGK